MEIDRKEQELRVALPAPQSKQTWTKHWLAKELQAKKVETIPRHSVSTTSVE